MPFASKSQLRTCYKKNDKNWDCKEFLDATPSVCCLPERKGATVKTRCMRKGERVVGKVKVGPRGGRYFTITEKDRQGIACTMKVYV